MNDRPVTELHFEKIKSAYIEQLHDVICQQQHMMNLLIRLLTKK